MSVLLSLVRSCHTNYQYPTWTDRQDSIFCYLEFMRLHLLIGSSCNISGLVTGCLMEDAQVQSHQKLQALQETFQVPILVIFLLL